jgi:large subunit ribosomal protein L35
MRARFRKRSQFDAKVIEKSGERIGNVADQGEVPERFPYVTTTSSILATRGPTHLVLSEEMPHFQSDCIGTGWMAQSHKYLSTSEVGAYHQAYQQTPMGLWGGVLHSNFPEKSVMPKLKTHKGAAKRFKKTGTGKVVRQHAFARHILTSKSRKRKNKLHGSVVADDSDQAKLQRMIPY